MAPKLNRLDIPGIDEYQLLSYRSASDKLAILTPSTGRKIMVLAQQALRALASHRGEGDQVLLCIPDGAGYSTDHRQCRNGTQTQVSVFGFYLLYGRVDHRIGVYLIRGTLCLEIGIMD